MAPDQTPEPADVDELRALLAAARAERDRLEEESGRAWGRLNQITSKRSYRLLSRVRVAGRRALPVRSSAPEPHPHPHRPRLTPCPRGLLLDVSPLDESVRSGIARVTIELARALDPLAGGMTPVRATATGLVTDNDHAAELGRRSDRNQPRFRAGRRGCPPLLVSAAVQPGHAMSAWRRSVEQVHGAGGRYVQIVHDLIPITHPDFFPGGMRRHFPIWLGQVVADADVILCDSQATLRDLRHWIADQGIATGAGSLGVITLAPFLASPEAGGTAEPARADALQVLTVGTVEPRKGVECVLAAAQVLQDHQPAVAFTLVGTPGWGSDALIARLRAAHADPTIPFTWLEGADDADLARLYRSADLVLQPSRAEGFGLPLAEALAMQTPVLARDIPVFREIVTDDTSFFATDADLVPALLRRLQDPRPSVAATPGWTWRDSAAQLLEVAGAETPSA